MACHIILFKKGTWTKHNEWTVKESQCVNERGISEEREASPDVLSQRIFSRPDQPLLCRQDTHTDTQRHTHAHSSQITSTNLFGVCAKQGHAHFWISSNLTWAVRILRACHITVVHHSSLAAADKVTVFKASSQLMTDTLLWKELSRSIKPLWLYLIDNQKW